MSVAIPKNVLDDHYFIFPAFTWRALEILGPEYLPLLMRPTVRYVSPASQLAPGVPEIEALIEEHAAAHTGHRASTAVRMKPR